MIEVLVVIAIFAVVLALAVPALRSFVVDTRLTSVANEFVTALALARSEAITRNGTVTVCKSSNSTSCATSGTWAQGWIVFVDSTGSGTIGTLDAGDTLLRAHGALDSTMSFVGTTDVSSYVAFVSDGRSVLANGAAQSGSLDVCVSAGSGNGRRISIAMGRATVAKLSC